MAGDGDGGGRREGFREVFVGWLAMTKLGVWVMPRDGMAGLVAGRMAGPMSPRRWIPVFEAPFTPE
jgi:hypothetical protein